MRAKGDGRFFKFFDPVFKRNARFAVKKPVPEIGDMNTPMIQVNKFYDYWINFESWRDFTGVGCDHNPDDAGSREEKRWMQKENKKKEEKSKKNEMQRLITLVTLAQKLDPRIAADKKNKKDAKDAIKQSKEAEAKQKAEEDAAIKAWAEEKAIDSNADSKAELSKAEKEKLKKAQSKVRNTLRKLLRTTAELGHGSGEYGIISEVDLEILCNKGNVDDLNTINNAMGGEPATKDSTLFIMAGTAEVLKMLEEVKLEANKDDEDDKIAKEIRRREAAIKSASNYKKVEKIWEDTDINQIKTALKMYPPSSNHVERWTKICNYVSVKVSSDDFYSYDDIVKIAYKATH